MPFALTFGSIGDIITISQIIAQLIKALSDSKASAAEHHQLLTELTSLQKALNHLDLLWSSQSNASDSNASDSNASDSNASDSNASDSNVVSQRPRKEILDSIKFAALACRQPLEIFLNLIQKYNNAMSGKTTN
jgi:hypothetical protein